ncbi:MAG: hypothetical protein JNJ71_09575 [Rubrivivax sp.]|nr:hypothetical protein [Rubrivivax sp.]
MPAAATVNLFGYYVLFTGIGLLLAPALVLGLLGMTAPADIWVRVLGALAIVVGYYYIHCAMRNDRHFFQASVLGRLGFAALCVLLVAAFGAPWQLLLFGVIDVAGALWTRHALAHGDDVPR